MKPEAAPLPGSVEDILKINESKPDDFYGMSAAEYLNLNFGAGSWVRDHVEDKYIVYVEENGARHYVVIDRQWRRYPVTIPAWRVH
jgi:hypothetical protein